VQARSANERTLDAPVIERPKLEKLADASRVAEYLTTLWPDASAWVEGILILHNDAVVVDPLVVCFDYREARMDIPVVIAFELVLLEGGPIFVEYHSEAGSVFAVFVLLLYILPLAKPLRYLLL
jgi:hypothetical protein